MSEPIEIDPDFSYETIIEDLEHTLTRLEDGGLPLAAALDAYAQGVALSTRAHELLNEAELRVESLREDG